MEEAQGFRALLSLQEPTYSIEQIAAKTGKAPAYVAQRVRLTELAASVVEAFYAEEINVGHALLLAKLQPDQQEKALAECFREEWGVAGNKPRRILLPVRHLQHRIDHRLMLILKLAPFSKSDPQLVPAAGSCSECPKRTGHNRLLFAEVQQDACTDPTCYAAKVEAHVQSSLTSKPALVQISTEYGALPEGSPAITRNKYVKIRAEKADTPDKAKWPEYRTCRFVAEALVTHGTEKGELRKVCANSECLTHNPKKQVSKADATFKAEQEKRRKEEALAQATSVRVLETIVAAVPVRLMKRNLLFIAELMLPMLDDQRIQFVARSWGIKAKEGESAAKLLTAHLRKAEESILGRLIVELAIMPSARAQPDGAKGLRAAAQTYNVNTDAVALKVKQEFAAKAKAKLSQKMEARPAAAAKKTA